MKNFAILLVLALLLTSCAVAPVQESTVPSTTLPVQTEPMPSVSSEPASLPPETTAPEKETEYYIFIPEDDPGLTWLWGYLGIKLEDYPNPYLYAKNMDTREICLLLDKDTKMFLQNGEDVYCITGENELYHLRLDIPGSQTLLYTAQYRELGSLSPLWPIRFSLSSFSACAFWTAIRPWGWTILPGTSFSTWNVPAHNGSGPIPPTASIGKTLPGNGSCGIVWPTRTSLWRTLEKKAQMKSDNMNLHSKAAYSMILRPFSRIMRIFVLSFCFPFYLLSEL